MSAFPPKVLSPNGCSSGRMSPGDLAKYEHEQMACDALRKIHLRKPRIWRRFPRTIVVLLTTLVVILIFTGSLLIPTEFSDQVAKAIGGAVVFFGIGYGFVQWNAARHEVTFDKYYERIDMGNERINDRRLAQYQGNKEATVDHYFNMLVFAEIDNLEYVLGKYRLGFVNFELTNRSIRTFRAQCDDVAFREKVLFWLGVTDQEQVAKGYEKDTRVAARFLVGHAEKYSREHDHAPSPSVLTDRSPEIVDGPSSR
jgi:hypothetical protein